MSSSLTIVCKFSPISSVGFESSRNTSHSGSSGEETWEGEGGREGKREGGREGGEGGEGGNLV